MTTGSPCSSSETLSADLSFEVGCRRDRQYAAAPTAASKPSHTAVVRTRRCSSWKGAAGGAPSDDRGLDMSKCPMNWRCPANVAVSHDFGPASHQHSSLTDYIFSGRKPAMRALRWQPMRQHRHRQSLFGRRLLL